MKKYLFEIIATDKTETSTKKNEMAVSPLFLNNTHLDELIFRLQEPILQNQKIVRVSEF